MAEIWKPVVGWKGFYEVSDRGRVRSIARKITRSNGRTMTILARVLSAPPNNDGYPHVTLHRTGQTVSAKVHTLVARAFHGKRPTGLEVRHLDGVEANCRAKNLVYGTSGQNGLDKVRHGTSTKGERNPKAKLTMKDVLAIRASIIATSDLAKAYGVCKSTIRDVRSRRSWGWL